MIKNNYSFLDLAEEVLTNHAAPMTVNEIWDYATEKNYLSKLNSKGKTPIASLGAQLYVDVKKDNSRFIISSVKPTKFFLSSGISASDENNILTDDESISIIKEDNFHERDLHPLLAKYLRESQFSAFPKTIFHEVSTKGKKGEWLHPDMVAIYFPFSKYDKETLKIADSLGDKLHKLYSFELKISLDFDNLRESFFQAVSNSSWANEGYLVAYNINYAILEDFKRLNSAFGIGLIHLRNTVEETEIIFNSKEKERLELNTLNLLLEKNKNFSEFIKNINDELEIADLDRVNIKKYDKILDDKEMEEYIKNKNIR